MDRTIEALAPLFMVVLAISWLSPAPAVAQSSSGAPDVHVSALRTLDGNSLDGFRTVGPAEWSASGGIITGTVRGGGGYLLLDDTVYGNTGVNVSFECDDCEPGVLVRSNPTARGVSGVLLALSGPEAGTFFRVAFDAQGRETSRVKMPGYTRQIITEGPDYLVTGGCAPVPCAGISDAHGGGGGSPGIVGAGTDLSMKAEGLNTVFVSTGNETLTGNINGTRLPNTVMDEGGLPYGKIALYVGGPEGATIRVNSLSVRDYTTRVAGLAPEVTSPDFEKVLLTDLFYAEGSAVGDLNQDGINDIVSGPFVYYGPDFQEARELYPPAVVPVAGSEYPGGPPTPQVGAITHGAYPPSFMSWIYDFNEDGWNDIFMIMSFGPRLTFSGYVFVNPQGERRHWDNHLVVDLITNEANQFLDMDGDGRPELSMQLATMSNWTDAQVGYATPNWDDPTSKWTFTPVSEKGRWSGHGLATGDVNGDGRLDFVSPVGWWERPAQPTDGLWTYHEARFGNGGADIFTYDVNDDGRPDIITSLAAHGPGLSWFEQQADGTFQERKIMVSRAERSSPDEVAFTELHALTLADMDGDGLQDILTGKRWYSHGYHYDEENDITDPPVIYWFKLVRDGNDVRYEPRMINNYSGVGVQIVAADVDDDGRMDVVSSARKGTAIFFNRMND